MSALFEERGRRRVAGAAAAPRPNLGRGTVEEQIAEGRKVIVEVTDA